MQHRNTLTRILGASRAIISVLLDLFNLIDKGRLAFS